MMIFDASTPSKSLGHKAPGHRPVRLSACKLRRNVEARQPALRFRIPLPAQPVPSMPSGEGVKVALLLPTTAAGDQAQIAISMKQAAEMALIDAGNSGITLISKDTAGTAAGRRGGGAAGSGGGRRTHPGTPAWSGGSSRRAHCAGAKHSGDRLFLLERGRRQRHISHELPARGGSFQHRAASRLRPARPRSRRFFPKCSTGLPSKKRSSPAGQHYGVTIAAIERFPRNNLSIVDPANKVVAAVNDPSRKIQALLIAEGGDLLRTIGAALKKAGYDQNRTQTLGTGLWDNPVTSSTSDRARRHLRRRVARPRAAVR